MKRKKICLLLTLCLIPVLLIGCKSKEERKEALLLKKANEQQLTIHEEEITVPGLKEDFELIFLADTHISLCDERDSSLLEKAAARYESFRDDQGNGADASFQALMDYTKTADPDLLILGGDIVDSAMYASLDLVAEELKQAEIPWLYGMGNHDFEYGSEYFSETAYSEYLPRLSTLSNTQSGFQTVEYDDFLIFITDDKNNQVSEAAAEGLAQAVEKGKPILLVTHVPIEPLTENTLLEETKEVWGPSDKGNSRVLLGDHACVPNKVTRKFLDLVLDEDSPVFLVLAGHIHFYHKDNLTENLSQIVTGAGFQRDMIHLSLKAEP